MICSRFLVCRDASWPVAQRGSQSLVLFASVRYSTQVYFPCAFGSALLKPLWFLKSIWIVHLTSELSVQQSITAKPAWSLPDRETKRVGTSLRKREGSERTPASVVAIGMSYNLLLCLYVCSFPTQIVKPGYSLPLPVPGSFDLIQGGCPQQEIYIKLRGRMHLKVIQSSRTF